MKELIFTLTTHAGTLTLTNSPDGWDESLVTWERSKKYWGMFRSWTVPLKFIKEGAKAVRKEFYTYGINADAQIQIQRLNKQNNQYYLAYSGDLEFSTFRDSNYQCECSFVDSGLSRYLKDNSGTEYDMPNGIILGVDSETGLPTGWLAPQDYYLMNGLIATEYWGLQLDDFAKNLINLMTTGGLVAGDYSFKSFIFDEYHDMILLTPGKQFRNPGANADGIFKTSWDDFWKSANSVLCLGMGEEIDENGLPCIRIEAKDYFLGTYQNNDLGEASTLGVSIDKELTYSKIKAGFDPREYNTENVDHEMNFGSRWKLNNPQSSTELDLVSKYRADWGGVSDLVAADSDANDDDIWFVQVYPDVILKVDARWSGKLALETFTAYNPFFSPRRCLERWYTFLASCTMIPDGVKLLYTACDNSVGYCQNNYDSGYISENSYIELVGNSWFYPVIFEIETALPVDLLRWLNEDPTQAFSFSFEGDNYLGYVMKVDTKLSGRGNNKITLLAHAANSFNNLIR